MLNLIYMYTVSIKRKRNQHAHPHLFLEKREFTYDVYVNMATYSLRLLIYPKCFKLNSCISCRVDSILADGDYTLIPEPQAEHRQEEVAAPATDTGPQDSEPYFDEEGKHRSMT